MKKYNGYALVTGGDSGIGYCIAEQLAINGYDLILVARNAEELAKTKEDLSKKYGNEIHILSKDLTEINSAKETYDFVQEKGLHVSLLVNNAGFGAWGVFDESKRDLEIKMIQLMCRSVVDLTHYFVPQMVEKGEGGVLLISGTLSRVHIPGFAVYSACKSFETHFGITLNYELQSKNIDVLVMCPSVTKTNFLDRSGTTDLIEEGLNNPLGLKYHSPEVVAKKALNNLGKKILIIDGYFLDRILFYTNCLLPLKLERIVMRLYEKYIFKFKY